MILGLGRSSGEGKKLPTPVFWPGEFHGLLGLKESDITEQLSLSLSCCYSAHLVNFQKLVGDNGILISFFPQHSLLIDGVSALMSEY